MGARQPQYDVHNGVAGRPEGGRLPGVGIRRVREGTRAHPEKTAGDRVRGRGGCGRRRTDERVLPPGLRGGRLANVQRLPAVRGFFNVTLLWTFVTQAGS